MDLWLSSTAPDTDLQVTLTEVRPDGQEMYLQKGWLKVSQRKLDPARSTALRPYQTHPQADVALLTPATPVLARVEIFPFGAVLHKGRGCGPGSRRRPSCRSCGRSPTSRATRSTRCCTTPTTRRGWCSPSYRMTPYRRTAAAACNSLIREPCRADPVASNPTGPGPDVPEVPYAVSCRWPPSPWPAQSSPRRRRA